MLARIFKSATMALVLLLSAGSGAQAHHSYATADRTKQITVLGTLKEFSFTAPHASATVVGQNDSGEAVEYKVTTVAPTALIKQGFKPKDFVIGDKVELVFYPNRNGTAGGLMRMLKLPGGRVLNGDML